MPTAIVTPSQLKNVKIPALNPYLAPQVICPNCKKLLDPKPGKDQESGQDSILYSCETPGCEYTLIAQPTHAQGRCVPTKSLHKKGPEEGLLGHAR